MAEEKSYEEENEKKEADNLEDDQDLETDDQGQMEEEIENLKNSLLRLQADFANFKNRSAKERSETIRSATVGLVEAILPVLDNFERAFGAAEDQGVDEGLIEGFRLIQKDLLNILKNEGLEVIESDGEIFDPNFHEAIATEPSDKEAGTILETLQKGYKFNDKVLRASIVKVSQ